MHTAVLTDTETIELEERERPDPGDDEVLVAMRDIGICGSDVHYYEHGRIGDYVVEGPLVLGHEAAGEVVAAGADVTEPAVGDRVALEPGVPCRRCEYCKRGAYHLCDDMAFMATPPVDGAFAEYVAWPADYAYRLPENVSTQVGALAEPLSVGIQAARRGDVGLGDSVLVTGAGPIGLMVADAAERAGATTVIVSDVIEEKLAYAAERGADATVDASAGDVDQQVRDHADGDGVDVVIEASGAPPAYETAFASVRRGGTIVCVGLAGEAEIPVDVVDLVLRDLDVRGSIRYTDTYPAAIDMLADDPDRFADLVDFVAPLAEVGASFERVQDPEVIKGMIQFPDAES